VFACCHSQPGILGNIYNEKLYNICNSKAIQVFRESVLSGHLKCYNKCTLQDKEAPIHPKSNTVVAYEDLKRLKILFGERCNIQCIMCRQDHSSRESIDYDKLIKHLDITPFETIEIQGGEPLFIPSAIKFFKYATLHGKKVSLLTNGLLLNRKWAERIACHSNFIHFSLNASTKETHESVNKGSSWEKVLDNIKCLRQIRDEYQTNLRIRGHMTIVVQNLSEIPGFIRNFRDFGFDQIGFGFVTEVRSYLIARPRMKLSLKAAVVRELKASSDISKISLLRLKLLGLI